MNNLQLSKELLFEEQPLRLFLHNGKIAFLTKEVGEILSILKPTQSVRQSKTLEEGIDHATIPSISLGRGNSLFPRNVNHVSVLYLSGFFLFVLRSNKPIAVPFTRWVIREAVPMAMMQNQPPEVTKEDFKLMELASKHKCAFARQLLKARGFAETDEEDKQLTFGESTRGGNHDD